MNKGILIKAGIILGFFAVTLGLALGCSSIKGNETTPEISNREDAYLTVGDITITNEDLWETMKISDGLNYLLQYSEEVLLADTIKDIDQADIDDAILELKWGTSDADTIAEIKEDAEVEAEFVKSYEEYLAILDIDPDNADELKDFVELTVAKKVITKEAIKTAGDDDPLKILDTKVEEYYETLEKGTVCVLDVKFNSDTEASAVFDEFNLVPDYNNGWGLYLNDATTPIEDVLTSDFDESNTTQLSDDQVFEKFLELYNYMNPSDTPIPSNTTQTDFCANYSDMAVIDWSEMYDEYDSSSIYYNYVSYLFDTLSLGEEDTDFNYSYKVTSASPFSMIAYKVSETAPTAYADLTDTEKEALLDELIVDELFNTDDNTAFSNAYDIAMESYWEANELEIFDPLLKLQYEQSEGVEFDNSGSETIVATLGTLEITADMLFGYIEENVGSYTAIELAKNEMLLASAFYTEMYGDSHDYLNSNNDAMVVHRDNLRNMKSSFSSNAYAAYGFDSSSITWEEFLIVAFGAYNEADVIETLYIIGSLAPNLVVEDMTYSVAKDLMDQRAADYLSLTSEHLLIYLDRDNDFVPDEFKEIVDGLTGTDLTDYNALAVAFENLILEKVNTDEMTYDEIVKEYNETLMDDATSEWVQFKEYGFHMLTQELGFLQSDGSYDYELTAEKIDGYFHDDFNVALKRIYDAYVTDDAAAGDDGIDVYVDNQIVKTDSGLHLITVEKGAAFEQPTAVYDNTDGDNSEGSEGTTVVPNEEQVELYVAIRNAEALSETTELMLPTSVYDAITEYYGDVYEAYFSSGYYSLHTAEYLLANNAEFATDNTSKLAYLETLIDVLYSKTFADGFVQPTND